MKKKRSVKQLGKGKPTTRPEPLSEYYEATVVDEDAESEYEDEPEFEPCKVFFVLDCAKIKRISNRQLYGYKLLPRPKCTSVLNEHFPNDLSSIISQYGEITEDIIRKFIELEPLRWKSFYDISDRDERKKAEKHWKEVEKPAMEEKREEFMKMYGIVPVSSDNELDDGQVDLTHFSLPVNSYDVEAPQKPYPKNMDLAHDGIFIYVLCEDENGKEFESCYWGD
jgi:hypothetical protein